MDLEAEDFIGSQLDYIRKSPIICLGKGSHLDPAVGTYHGRQVEEFGGRESEFHERVLVVGLGDVFGVGRPLIRIGEDV
jgi:hypothetical protein